MAKQDKGGRPGLSYAQYVEVWEQCIEEGRVNNNAVREILGGSRSTIVAFRERYEREKTAREVSIIKDIELNDAVLQAIATIKVKEIEALEKVHMQLKARLDENITTINELEKSCAAATAALGAAKSHFEDEKLKLAKRLAIGEARVDDLTLNAQKYAEKCEQLSEQYNQAKQEAAVAKKEVELLREQSKKNK